MSRAAVLALAAERGVRVTSGGGGWFEVMLEAPAGMRWTADCHELVVSGYREDSAAKVWADALRQLRTAEVERCTEAGCEWCGDGEVAS